MPFEIHGGMEDTDDLQGLAFEPEKDDVTPLGSYPTTGKKVVPRAEKLGIFANRAEA